MKTIVEIQFDDFDAHIGNPYYSSFQIEYNLKRISLQKEVVELCQRNEEEYTIPFSLIHVEGDQIFPSSYSIRIINHKRNLIVVRIKENYKSSFELWSDYEDDFSKNRTVELMLSNNFRYKFNNNNVIDEDLNINY